MNPDHSVDGQSIQEAIGKICKPFDDDYWRRKDTDEIFPHEFYDAIASQGWLGIAMPESVGGSGLGITEAAIMMQSIAESGAGMSGASAIHMNIFGLQPVVVYGTGEQQQRMLPPLVAGKEKACFAVTEPDAGLNTTEIKTAAELRGDHYVVNGQKSWISTAQVSSKMLLLARTTPVDRRTSKTHGLSLFYTALDRSAVQVREIPKMGRAAVDSNMLFIDNLIVPVEDRIGPDGNGFQQILHGFNPERILIASEAVGLGRAAIRKASAYARQRSVFGRPIGKNQAIQHPLARAWMQLEAANLMVFKAAGLYDAGKECGAEANSAKFLAAEAAFYACEQAVLTHGGMGYAKEYHVERYLRESWIPRLAPVSMQLICSYIAERILEQPKSY
jgi:acyl-CoA dehydrogenase